MALKKLLKELVFAQGVDTKTDPHVVPVGKLHRLENVRQKKVGSFQKRFGSDAITKAIYYFSSGWTYSGGIRLSRNKNQALLIPSSTTLSSTIEPVGKYLLTYDQIASNWVAAGLVNSFITTKIPFISAASTLVSKSSFFDMAYVGGYLVISYTYPSGAIDFVSVSFIDPNTQNASSQVASISILQGTSAKIVSFNGKLTIIVQDSATTANIKAYQYDFSTKSLSAGTNLVTDSAIAGNFFDVAVDSTNNILYLAYFDNAGNVRVRSFNAALVLQNTYTAVEAVTANSAFAIGVNPVSNRVYALWNTAAGTRLVILNLTLGVVTALATLDAVKSRAISVTPQPSSAQTIIVYNTDNAGSRIVLGIVYNAAGFLANIATLRGAYLASKGAFYNGTLLIAVHSVNTNQEAGWIWALRYGSSAGNFICSRFMYGVAYISSLSYIPLHQSTIIGNSLFNAFQQIIDSISSSDSSINSQIVKNDLVSDDAFNFVEMNGDTYFSGGYLIKYDGYVARAGQGRLYPQIISVTGKVATAILAVGGTYSFVVVGVRIDAQGNIEASAPSEPISITLGGVNNNVDIVTAELLAMDFDKLYLYRTVSLGSDYFYDSQIDYTVSGGSTTISPKTTDADIIANEELYTDGGDLSNLAPPAPRALAVWQDRLWALTEDKIRYSKKTQPNKPPLFADELFIDIETDGGEPVAIAPFGDKLLVFKKDAIYYTIGDGPNDQGLGGGFAPFKEITKTMGALSQRTVLALGDQVWFQSKSGYFKIDSSLALTQVGLPIDYFITTTPVRSIEYFSANDEIRISDGTRTFVFNTITEQWSIDTWSDESQIVVNDQFWRLTATGDVLVENSSNFQDGGNNYSINITTGWITPEMIQGLERFYRLIILGRLILEAPIKIEIFYDYIPQVAYTYTLNPTGKGMVKFSNANVYENNSFSSSDNLPFQWEVHLPRQKCQAIRFSISDVPSSSSNTFELVALGLQYGVKNIYPSTPATVKA